MAGSGETQTAGESLLQRTIAEELQQVWTWSREGKPPESAGRDGFPVYAEDPFAERQRLLSNYLQQLNPRLDHWNIKPKDLPVTSVLLAGSETERLLTLRAIIVRILFHRQKQEEGAGSSRMWLRDQVHLLKRIAGLSKEREQQEEQIDPVAFGTLADELFRTNLSFTESDLITFVGIAMEQEPSDFCHPLADATVLRSLEVYSSHSEFSPALRAMLEEWRQNLQAGGKISSPARELLTRINDLLGQEGNSGIQHGEAWSNTALVDLKKMRPPDCSRWVALLKHCQTAESSKPAQKWSKAAKGLVEAIGADAFKTVVIRWFELVKLPRPIHREPREPQWEPDPDQLIDDSNSVILKGLAWCCAGFPDADVSRALGELAQTCFKKVRYLGARCPRVGNACLYSLSVMGGEHAAAQLCRLDQIVKQPSAKKLLGKSLTKAAEISGQTREDLEESTVPDYGLDSAGTLRQPFGDFTAELKITDPETIEVVWRNADGKLQKSVPTEVKNNHADAFKKFKRTIKDIETMLPAQRIRIERLFMSERQWTLEQWRARYVDHPLLSVVARRLIWHFRLGERTALGTWHEGKMRDVEGTAIDWLAPETIVRLWHPIGFGMEIVQAWRRWLETHEICQPFKQAHREIYVITDAELNTETYSNRFAAHILRQHQFSALARQRGWKYALMGNFDFQSTPTLELPQWQLAVEFWVQSTGGRQDASESGISLYLSTDQVRFLRGEETRPLRDIPAQVFSEVMRDVDLFVGVCSIGNDPAWRDRGEIEGGGVYWTHYSFGELSASAHTRRDVLERLLPKLKIAKQCSLQERYLVVNGSFRTYKIHLGSGNILMEPNDQYLCIVPDHRANAIKPADKVFLPFEGDSTLAVILSKAFLLADDAKIKDETIMRQIGNR